MFAYKCDNGMYLTFFFKITFLLEVTFSLIRKVESEFKRNSLRAVLNYLSFLSINQVKSESLMVLSILQTNIIGGTAYLRSRVDINL